MIGTTNAVGSNITADMLGIVIKGNSTPVGAAIGQYVIVKNSTISGITDGLYTAAQAIPANTAIDSTYLSSVDNGGFNSVKSFFLDPPIAKYKDIVINVSLPANGYLENSIASYALSGYTIIGGEIYTGSTVELRNQVAVTIKCIINSNGLVIKNYYNQAVTGTITFRVFYIRSDLIVAAT